MSFTKTEFSFPSVSGLSEIHAVKYIPNGEIKAVFQIAHGMAEHIVRYESFCGDLADKVTEKYSLVVANILADVIMLFSTQVRAFMLPGAKFIASGIIDTRADEVVACLQNAGLNVIERRENGGWVCLVCE